MVEKSQVKTAGAKGKARTSLSDFAKAEGQRRGPTCWVCTLPERAEIDRAFANKPGDTHVAMTAVARWLRDECGYEEATTSRISNHVTNHLT